MILAYGSYRYAANSAGITISKQADLNDAQEPVRTITRARVMTRLLNPGTTRATMNAAVAAFLAAHDYQGRDLILYQPDGTTKTVHSWPSSTTIGGVRVVGPPSFPEYEGAEAINYRTIQVEYELVTAITNRRTALRSFTERLQTSGGGPEYVMLKTLNGPPVRQMRYKQTPYVVTQTGSAVGLFDTPAIPPPIWPSALMEAPQIDPDGGRRLGTAQVDFGISWSYRFESTTPLAGKPNRWAVGA